ncbi:MAG: O-antigen ligase family protein [Pseudomonadota bacterium]
MSTHLPAQKRSAAAIAIVLFIAVAVGRVHELVPALSSLQLGKLTIVLAFFMTVFFAGNKNRVRDSRIARKMLWFSALIVLSVAFSVWTAGSFEFLLVQLPTMVFLFFLVYVTAANEQTLEFYLRFLVWFLVIFAAFGITGLTSDRLAFSTTYDPNDIGLVVLVLSAFIIGLSLDSNRKYVLAYRALGAIGFAVVIATQSRGAFLGLCVVITYFLFANRDSERMRLYSAPKVSALVGVTLLLVLAIALAPDEAWLRIQTIFELEDDYNTSGDRGRLAIWGRGLVAFLERPWGFGVGAYMSADLSVGGSWQTAHNIFIQVLVELGLIGFILFLGLCFSVWITGRQLLLRRETMQHGVSYISNFALGHALRASILAYVTCGFFLSMAYASLFYYLLGMTAAIAALRLPK